MFPSQVKHPDYILFQGQSIDIGRMLSVGPNDSLFALARRYGTTVQVRATRHSSPARRPPSSDVSVSERVRERVVLSVKSIL